MIITIKYEILILMKITDGNNNNNFDDNYY